MSEPDSPHPFWMELGASAWANAQTVSMREAIHKVGHGSTAGAKMVAAGVLPTVATPGYQNPRVGVATIDLLLARPTFERDALAGMTGTIVVRCGGPHRAGEAPDPVEEHLARAYYGFHRTMTRRQAVPSTASWWSLHPRTLGLPGTRLAPGRAYDVGVDRLLVTVGGLVVLDGRIVRAHVRAPILEGYVRPLVGFELADPDDDAVGTWLPPTRSGNVALRAADW